MVFSHAEVSMGHQPLSKCWFCALGYRDLWSFLNPSRSREHAMGSVGPDRHGILVPVVLQVADLLTQELSISSV